MSLVSDIADRLAAAGIAEGQTGWSIHYADLPDSPDTCISITETVGQSSDITGHDYPSFQVMLRGAVGTYSTVRAKAQEIYDNLDDAEVSNYVYIFAAHSGIIPLGQDGKKRPVIAINFDTMRVV
jgi:hypothetical protein